MKTSTIITRAPRFLTIPGFRGGPAPYAGQVLTVIWLGRSCATAVVRATVANDNGTGEVA